MEMLKKIALVLVIIGGLNWGLIGLFEMNLVTSIFGGMPMLTKLIYGLVGLSAVYLAFTSFAAKKPVKTEEKTPEF